jgi:hypothetical protein
VNITVKQEINKLKNKYSPKGGEELFKAELEYLVALVEREQMKKDHEQTMEILKTKN